MLNTQTTTVNLDNRIPYTPEQIQAILAENARLKGENKGLKDQNSQQWKLLQTMAIQTQQETTYKGDNILFKDFVQEWLEYRLNTKSLAPSTVVKNERALMHPLRALGDKYLNSIAVDDIEQFFNNDVSHLASATIHDIRSALSMVFKRAEKHELIKKNPMTLLDLPKTEREAGSPHRAFTVDEIHRIQNATKEQRLWILAYLLPYAGLRPEEALGLHWDDINLEKGTLKIVRAFTKDAKSKAYLKTPKNKSSIRTVIIADVFGHELGGLAPIDAVIRDRKIRLPHRYLLADPKVLCEKLAIYKQEQFDRYGKRKIVISNRQKKEGYTHPQTLLNIARVWRKLTGVSDFKWHNYRHTYISHLIENDMPLMDIKKQTGHKTTRVIEEVYAHTVTDKAQRKCADTIEKALA